jgi:hypothetical protein
VVGLLQVQALHFLVHLLYSSLPFLCFAVTWSE